MCVRVHHRAHACLLGSRVEAARAVLLAAARAMLKSQVGSGAGACLRRARDDAGLGDAAKVAVVDVEGEGVPEAGMHVAENGVGQQNRLLKVRDAQDTAAVDVDLSLTGGADNVKRAAGAVAVHKVLVRALMDCKR